MGFFNEKDNSHCKKRVHLPYGVLKKKFCELRSLPNQYQGIP